MHKTLFAILFSFVTALALSMFSPAQQPTSSSIFAMAAAERPQVPRLIRFSGSVTAAADLRTVGITFFLYKDQTGGAPLWQEVQNVTFDAAGHYSILLGANSKDGIPAELFTTNEARWLGVQVEQEPEQARVLLVSVPYALKAGDAETVGGHPLTDFVLTAASNVSANSSGSTSTTSPTTKSSVTSNAIIAPLAGTVGAGSLNAVAKYDISGNLLGSTLVFDTGSALGIGTQSPLAALDVNSTTAPSSGVTPYGFRAINAMTVGQTNNFPQNGFSSVYSGTATQGYIYGLVNNIQKTGTGPLTNAYGVLSSVQNNNATGAITNAYAFVAQQPVTTGPITNSYGFYAEDPNSINYFAGKVGIGTNAPQAGLDISNVSAPASGVSPNGFRAVGNITVGQTNNFPQNNFSSVYSGTGTQGFIYGLVNQIQKTGTGPLTNAYGVLSSVQNNNATGAITNAYAFVAQQPVRTGPITNSYAFYAEDANSTNFFAGKVGIGNVSPGQMLSVAGTIESTTGGFKFPNGSTQTSAATGTITGVSAGSGLTGGGISAGVSLAVDSTKVPFLAAANIFTNSQTINAAGTTLSVSGGSIGLNANGSTYGVYGYSSSNYGVYGSSSSGFGVRGFSSSSYGVQGVSSSSTGVYGSGSIYGVYGSGATNGVYGYSSSGFGVRGYSSNSNGVDGYSAGSTGVYGESGSSSGDGVIGYAPYGNGVSGTGGDVGVYGSSAGWAGYFDGDVWIGGSVYGTTSGVKIDHPLDPANKYLYHSSVISPDMKNIYDGLVTLDVSGEAVVPLPEWFGALNRDFRYQLTAIGAPAPGLYIAEEISNNQFKIAGGKPNAKVSWQVTGIRQDADANAHRIPVEQQKTGLETGTYRHPKLFGQPESLGLKAVKEAARAKAMIKNPRR